MPGLKKDLSLPNSVFKQKQGESISEESVYTHYSEEMPSVSDSVEYEISHSKEAIYRQCLFSCKTFFKSGCKFLTQIRDRVLFYLFLQWIYDGFLYNSQDLLMYQPKVPLDSREIVVRPSQYGLRYRSGYIRSADRTFLHYFFIFQHRNLRKQVPTILYFHGNAGNIGHRLANAYDLYHYLKCNIFMLEYRGYGLSSGSPSESGFYADARAAFDFLASCDKINRKQIIVFGRSLGGAVAVDLASRMKYRDVIWCVILENTFTNVPELAKCVFGWHILNFLPTYFYKNNFNSLKKIKDITAPTLFLSGMCDELVPTEMMKQLFESCEASYKNFVGLKNGTHDGMWNCPGYYVYIAEFLLNVESRNRLRKKAILQVGGKRNYSR